MDRSTLVFVSERKIEINQEPIPKLENGQVLVKMIYSGISAGSELLIYRGQFPKNMQTDESIEVLGGELEYPLKYGYSAVGEVVEVGKGVGKEWKGIKVFSFNPHETHFVSNIENLHKLPKGIDIVNAIFVPNMETAVNFIMDGRPQLGERVVVFGQGIVGLLTTSLLAQYPLSELITVDGLENRRETSLKIGADKSYAATDLEGLKTLKVGWEHSPYNGADLIYELSGNPDALNYAIDLAGFDGRIVIGSWYGDKRAHLNLGTDFHRKRIQLISSQVSTVTPELRGRWDKDRRFQITWDMIQSISPSKFISHRIPFAEAERAYKLLDKNPKETLQIILEY